MVKFENARIGLRRKDEILVFSVGDYEEAAFENTEGISGNLPYLRIKGNNGLEQYYPLEYWEIKIVGERV